MFRKALEAHVTEPVVTLMARTSLTPNTVTWIGFFIILVAAALIGLGHPFAAGWVMLASGVFDMLDGSLARRTNQVTRFGGILDSTLDRVSEAAILIGLMAYFLYHKTVPSGNWIIIMIGFTLASSFVVSYIRSRAEAAQINCEVGIFTRTERVIILALGLLISAVDYVLVIVLAIITLLSIVTIVQRLSHAYKQSIK